MTIHSFKKPWSKQGNSPRLQKSKGHGASGETVLGYRRAKAMEQAGKQS